MTSYRAHKKFEKQKTTVYFSARHNNICKQAAHFITVQLNQKVFIIIPDSQTAEVLIVAVFDTLFIP
jgi:hypothetical protein